jgi:hypothetical protein
MACPTAPFPFAAFHTDCDERPVWIQRFVADACRCTMECADKYP